ncbi:MAG: hypothetical protein HZC28_05160 [Spirochaetes bacterium]|nr:hypothetical protein [Spirochaetota bacterium]
MSESVVYKNALIFYFDLLGTKNRISDNCANINYDIFKTFKDMTTSNIKIKYTFSLSDTVVYVVDEIKPNTLYYIYYFMTTLQYELFQRHGVFIRGSIVHGKIFYSSDENLIFGPALIKAHAIAEKHGMPPLIYVDKSVFDVFNNDPKALISDSNYIGTPEKDYYDSTWDSIKTSFFSTYTDIKGIEHTYCDYLFNGLGFASSKMETYKEINDAYPKLLQEHKSVIMRCLAYYNDDSILSKYYWLARYHNRTILRHMINSSFLINNNSIKSLLIEGYYGLTEEEIKVVERKG